MKIWHGGCHCRAHGGVSTSDPAGSVLFTHREPQLQSGYRFGHKTADFIFCGRCGGYLGAVTEENGMDPQPEGLPAAQPMSYDGESGGARDARRAGRWTPVSDS